MKRVIWRKPLGMRVQNAVDPVAIAKIVTHYMMLVRPKANASITKGYRLSRGYQKVIVGQRKSAKLHNLALRFQKYKDMVLLFLHDLSRSVH